MKGQRPTPDRGLRRDLLVGTISAVLAGLIVGAWYEWHSMGFSSLSQEVEWLLRKLEMAGKLPTVRCTRDIPSGSIITLDALKITHEYNESNLPANAIGDPYIAIARKARRTVRKGDLLDYSDVFERNYLP